MTTTRFERPKKDERDRDPDSVEPLTRGAYNLWTTKRDAHCQLCALHDWSRTVCMFGNGPVPAEGMVVFEGPSVLDTERKRPVQGEVGRFFDNMLRDADLDRADLYITYATRCTPPRENREELLKVAKKACAPYLEAELEAVKPRVVLAVGQLAHYFFSHKAGIVNSRGQPYFSEKYQCTVLPTVHPTYVLNYPAYYEAFTSDIRRFGRMLRREDTDPKFDIVEVRTLDDFRRAMAELEALDPRILTFDFETRGFYDHDPEQFQAWCIAATRGEDRGAGRRVYLIPLEHPDSPFLAPHGPLDPWPSPERWPPDPPLRVAPEYHEVVEGVIGLLDRARSNGHNVKFDARQACRLAERYGLEWPY